MKCIKKLVALTLAAVLALAMLTACGGTPSVPEVTEETKQIVADINAVRTENGLSALESNTAAMDVANKYLALQEKKALNQISAENFQKEWMQLAITRVDGRHSDGYDSKSGDSFSGLYMSKAYWQGMYNMNNMDFGACKIVRSTKAKYLGVAVKQFSNGEYCAIVVTY